MTQRLKVETPKTKSNFGTFLKEGLDQIEVFHDAQFVGIIDSDHFSDAIDNRMSHQAVFFNEKVSGMLDMKSREFTAIIEEDTDDEDKELSKVEELSIDENNAMFDAHIANHPNGSGEFYPNKIPLTKAEFQQMLDDIPNAIEKTIALNAAHGIHLFQPQVTKEPVSVPRNFKQEISNIYDVVSSFIPPEPSKDVSLENIDTEIANLELQKEKLKSQKIYLKIGPAPTIDPTDPLASESDDLGDDKPFRWQGKRIMLTYKTHVPKKEFIAWFMSHQKSPSVTFIRIAHENGVNDPKTPYKHSHVLIQYNKQNDVKSNRFWDITSEGCIIHPHLKFINNNDHWKMCYQYLAKEDPENEDMKSYFSLAEKIWKHPSIQDVMKDQMQQPSDVLGLQALYKLKPMPTPKYRNHILSPWQQSIYDIISEEPDERTILWIFDKQGGAGKTWFCRKLAIDNPDLFYTVNDLGGSKNAATIIQSAYESGWQGHCLLINLARDDQDHSIYKPIENIKDGLTTTTKYVGKTTIGPQPHVVIFANFYPNYWKLTMDRWDVREILRGGSGEPLTLSRRLSIDELKIAHKEFSLEQKLYRDSYDASRMAEACRNPNRNVLPPVYESQTYVNNATHY